MRNDRRAPPSSRNCLGALLLAGGLCGLGTPARADAPANDELERPPTVRAGSPEDEAAAAMQFPHPASGAAPSGAIAWKTALPAGWGDAVGYGGAGGTDTRDDGTAAPAALDDDEDEEDDIPALSAFGGRSRPGGCINGALHISVCGPDMQAWQQSAEFALKDMWRRISGQAPTIRTTLRNAPAQARPTLSRNGWRLRVNRRMLMLNWQVRF